MSEKLEQEKEKLQQVEEEIKKHKVRQTFERHADSRPRSLSSLRISASLRPKPRRISVPSFP